MTWEEFKFLVDKSIALLHPNLNHKQVKVHYIDVVYPTLLYGNNPFDVEVDTSNDNELRVRTISDSN